jgi:hypothetical protein
MCQWYVKIAKSGRVIESATTQHSNRPACIRYIANVIDQHPLESTTFFFGRDGEKAEEVSFKASDSPTSNWTNGTCRRCWKIGRIHDGYDWCEGCIFGAEPEDHAPQY